MHEDQLSWGEDIKHRPVELRMFDPSGGENEPKKAIGHLKYDGKLVVDYRHEPVQAFPSLPLVISSNAEGWRIEGWMRSDKRIRITDIVARIPVVVITDPAGHRIRVPEYQAGTLRERAKKFRHLTGLVPWKSKGDPRIKEFMDSLRSPAEKSRNQAIGRDLTDLERTSLASLNIGTRPDRGKPRQNPRAHEDYMNQVKKKADLTFDFDCREERPENPEEIQQIQNALQRTYDDFVSYTNTPPKMPDTRDSYLDQWNFLQVQLNKFWANDSTKINEPPQLFALAKWTVSFDNWVSTPQTYLTYVRD